MSSAVTTQVTELQNYIDGGWRRSSSTEFYEVSNPATAELIARTPLSLPADVEPAVQAAAAAFPAWRRTPAGERMQYLFKLKILLEEHIDELSRLITLENGKTFGEAKAELRRGIENVEVACGIPMMMQGYNLEDVTPGVDEMQIRQPLGVVAAIVPFNFPAMIPFWFLPYAIACGNTFVLKPSERVPMTWRAHFELARENGLPQRRGQCGEWRAGRGRCAVRSSRRCGRSALWARRRSRSTFTSVRRRRESACNARAARRIMLSFYPMRIWISPRRSSVTAHSDARASAAWRFPLPSRLAKRKRHFVIRSRMPLRHQSWRSA